jgi:predicted ATPase/DNA-binding winged helix-turn-helix (wHTH) protein
MVGEPIIDNENAAAHGAVAFGPFRLAPGERLLERAGVAVPIGGRAFEILVVLVERAGEIVSKRDLIARAWPDVTVDEGSLRVHITALRRALGDGRSGARYVTNVPGRGYCFVAPVLRSEPASPPPKENAASGRAHNLPARLTRMIGRDDAVRTISAQLRMHRFLNIVGPGGIGKTTVAVSVGHALLNQFEGAIHFIDLATLKDPNLVASTVAHTLGVPVNSDNAIPSLVSFLRNGGPLLILDNCEHVIDAVSTLGESIFREAPRVHILATSREPMRIEGEHVHRLFPLDCPPDGSRLTAAEALGFPAVQLFMERIAASSDRPPLGDHEAPTVAEICRKLDGIPLAIEFAAARVATLGVFEVAAHLNDRLALLTKGRRTALPRHQTLRAALDWSYELLPEPERRLLCRLAVFPGGFTLEAATAVVGEDDYGAPAVVEGIANLASKSLLSFDGSMSPGRGRLLETTRAYAFEKLCESGEAERVAQRHAEFFRDFFTSIETGSKIEAAVDDLVRYRQEIDNVRAALDWSFSPGGDASSGVVLTTAYAWIWLQLSLYFECSERAGQALDGLGTGSDLDVPSRLQLLLALAMSLTSTMGPVETAQNVLVTARRIAEDHDEFGVHLWILWALWSLQLNTGKCRAARSTAERYGRVAPGTGDLASILAGHRLLGTAIQLGGDQNEARRHLERALEPPFSENDPQHPVWPKQHRAMTSATLVRTLWMQGFANQARDHARESVEEAYAGPVEVTRFEVLRLAACPVAFMTGDIVAAEQAATMMTDITAGTNAVFWKVVAQCIESQLRIRRGEFERGVIVLRAFLENCEKTGWKPAYPEYLGVLAEGLAGLGRYAEAIAMADRALAAADHGGERWYVAELLRIKGEFLLQEAGDNSILVAEGWFREALQLARKQGALSWELRTAFSLAGLKVRQGRRDQARQILAPIYDRFTEGFETADLRSARTMLESL